MSYRSSRKRKYGGRDYVSSKKPRYAYGRKMPKTIKKRNLAPYMSNTLAPAVSRNLSSPRKLLQVFSYNEEYNLANLGGVVGYSDIVYRANSLYDPNLTGGGYTVAGHAAWGYIYQKYYVYASSIEVTVINDDDEPLGVSVFAQVGSTAVTDFMQARNSPGGRNMLLSSQGGQDRGTIKLYNRAQKIVDKRTRDDFDYHATFGSNPTSGWFWHVFTRKETGETQVGKMMIRVIYYTMLYKPHILPQSAF